MVGSVSRTLGRGARLAVGLAMLVAAACTRDELPRKATHDGARETATAADEDPLDTLMDRTARAFERDGDALVARGTAATAPFVARVARDGAIAFSPSPPLRARLELRTTSPARSPAMMTEDRTEVIVARGESEEHLRNGGGALEQSWRFVTRPATPPVVRVAVSGMRYAGESASGHHFVDDASGLGVRYGAATWIDAGGKRSAVPVAHEGDELVMRVPPEIAAGPYPATLDPTLTPEQGVDQPVSATTGRVTSVAIAPGPADGFLAAWIDSGVTNAPASVRVARIGADGVAIGQARTVIADPRSVAVAWDGQRWLVAAAGAAGTRLVRVAADGTVLDPTPKLVPGESTSAAVAFDGTKFLVAWTNVPSGSTGPLQALRVDGATGTFDANTALTLATDVSAESPSAACGTPSTGCAVLWRSAAGVRVGRVSSADAVLDAGGIDLGTGSDLGGIASDGAQWLATWRDGSSLDAARIAADGTIAPVGSLTSLGVAAQNVTWDGTSFVALFCYSGSLSRPLYAQRIAPDGTLVGSRVTLQSPGASAAAFGASGTARVVLWAASSNFGISPLYSRAFSSTLAPLAAAAPAILGGNQQQLVSAAYNGSTFLVLWRDNRLSPGEGVYAARLSSTGVPLDAVGTKIDFEGPMASDGNGFLVVRLSAGVQAIRFGKDSAVPIDATPIVVATGDALFGADVAFDGMSYVVVWTSTKTDALTWRDIRAARVTPGGVVLDPEGFAATTANGAQEGPSIASNGKGSLVTWGDYRSDYYNGDVFGTRISQAGQVLDPQGIPIAKRSQGQHSPSAAPNGDGYTVTWLDDASGDWDVLATRVSASGAVDPTPVAIARDITRADPLIVDMQDGVSQLVAWGGTSNSTSPLLGSFLRRTPALELLDPKPIALSVEPGPSRGLAAVPAGPGRAAIFYARYSETDRAMRLRLRFASSGATPGTTCTATTDCQSRYCTDAVCCAEKCDGPCRRCGGTSGACEPVRSADDPDTCTGENTCDATGACKKKNGSVCQLASDCASGFCVDSFCCNVACEGACEGCADVRGTCTPLPRGTLGTPSCSPNRCDGKSGACATECVTDADCADGFGCDRPTKTCIAGAVCTDVKTVREVNGTTKDCAPYTCRAGKCGASCTGVTDCAFPAVCEESGRCVEPPPPDDSGCAVTPTRRSNGSGASAIMLVLGSLSLARARRRRRA